MVRGLLLVLVFCLPLSALRAADLLLYTEEWPPLNFARDGQLSGYSVELVQELSKRTGDSVRIELVPWTRGYTLAQVQPNVGLFTVGRIPERESLFQWVGPFVSAHDRFYTLKGSPLKITNLADARRQRLVLPRLWYSLQYLQGQGFDNIYTVTTPEIMMSMFHNGRSDLLAASDLSLPSTLALAGMTPDDVEPQFSFLEHQSYLVFSPATDPSIVARWQKAFDNMKREGGLASLYQRWVKHLPVPRELTAGD